MPKITGLENASVFFIQDGEYTIGDDTEIKLTPDMAKSAFWDERNDLPIVWQVPNLEINFASENLERDSFDKLAFEFGFFPCYEVSFDGIEHLTSEQADKMCRAIADGIYVATGQFVGVRLAPIIDKDGE